MGRGSLKHTQKVLCSWRRSPHMSQRLQFGRDRELWKGWENGQQPCIQTPGGLGNRFPFRTAHTSCSPSVWPPTSRKLLCCKPSTQHLHQVVQPCPLLNSSSSFEICCSSCDSFLGRRHLCPPRYHNRNLCVTCRLFSSHIWLWMFKVIHLCPFFWDSRRHLPPFLYFCKYSSNSGLNISHLVPTASLPIICLGHQFLSHGLYIALIVRATLWTGIGRDKQNLSLFPPCCYLRLPDITATIIHPLPLKKSITS